MGYDVVEMGEGDKEGEGEGDRGRERVEGERFHLCCGGGSLLVLECLCEEEEEDEEEVGSGACPLATVQWTTETTQQVVFIAHKPCTAHIVTWSK